MSSSVPHIDVAEPAAGHICVQCRHSQHAADAAYCNRCGGILGASVVAVDEEEAQVVSPTPMAGASQDRAALHAVPPAVTQLLDSLNPMEREKLNFSVRLWDQAPLAFEKSRAAKHTAKAMAAFYTELSKIEKAYALGIQKICTSPDYGQVIEAAELKSPLKSTLVNAWNAIRADLLARSRNHSALSDVLNTRVALPLDELRKQLSWKKDRLEQAVNDAHDLLKKSQETHSKLKAKHEKQAMEFNLKGAASKLTQHDVHLAFESQSMAEVQMFQAKNAYNRAISENLSAIQVLELDRMLTTRRLLLQHRLAQAQSDRAYLPGEKDVYVKVQGVDAKEEVGAWVDAHQSKNECPWATPKIAASLLAVATSPTGRNFISANPAGAGASSSSGGGGPAQQSAPAVPIDPATAARIKRDARGSTKLAAGGSSPEIVTLRIAPITAAAALPAPLTLQDLPFPTFGSSSKLEAPSTAPADHWLPSSLSQLFPKDDPATMPDLKGMILEGREYNRICYEQLLLSTHLLVDIKKVEHVETIVNMLRVQMHITQSEHDLLLNVLKGDGQAEKEDMNTVHYRLTLLKNTRSSRFPNLNQYARWFARQIHVVWLAVLWTIDAERKDRGDEAKATLSLRRFKQTLQLVQLISFNLTSKISTKLFTQGDSIAEHHQDMLDDIEELEKVMSKFPEPYATRDESASADSSPTLSYPQPLLHRVYTHLIVMGGMKGADETGKPEKEEKGSDDEDEDEDEDEETLSLNESYQEVIAALSRSRKLWRVTEFQHQSALLQLVMHIAHYQAELYDGRLLDADGFLSTEGDDSLLPLLTNICQSLSGGASSSSSSDRDRSSSASSSAAGPVSLDPSQLRLLAYILRQLSTALVDFHRFPSTSVATLVAFYQRLIECMGVKDGPRRVETMMQISSTQFYQTIIPTETMLIVAKAHKRKTSETADGDDDEPQPKKPEADSQIALQPKKMQAWSPDEWKSFTKQLCSFVREQVEEFAPEFEKVKANNAGSGSGESGMKLAETCIVQILHCVQHDVDTLLADRMHEKTGMDDTLVCLVASLVRLQSVVMDTEYAAFWSSPAVKKSIALAFPNLQKLCSGAMTRWLDVQKSKVEGIRDRCVSLDEWQPVDSEAGLKYSHSVKDLFRFLHTLHEGFWTHAKNMHGFGVADSLQVFIDLFDVTLIQYGVQIVQSAGLDAIPMILPTKEVKLKQAKEAPDNKDKAKAFVKGLFKKEEKKTAPPNTPGGNADEDGPIATDIPRIGLAAQSIPSLCVRLCCIEAAIDNSSELSHSLETHIHSFTADFPLVASTSASSSRKNSHSQTDKLDFDAAVKAEKRFENWKGFFTPPQRMPKIDGENVFSHSIDQLHEQIEQLANGIGVMKVYVDWRSTWLTKLYAPMPLESNRIKDGELEARVEESMPTVHSNLTRTLFCVVAKHILTQLMTAVQYVLLYGRRSIQEEQIRSIVKGDVGSLILSFEKIVPGPEMREATKGIEQLCQVMEIPTDDLIHMYSIQKAPVPLPILARIIAARSGKPAQKLIDKIRGK